MLSPNTNGKEASPEGWLEEIPRTDCIAEGAGEREWIARAPKHLFCRFLSSDVTQHSDRVSFCSPSKREISLISEISFYNVDFLQPIRGWGRFQSRFKLNGVKRPYSPKLVSISETGTSTPIQHAMESSTPSRFRGCLSSAKFINRCWWLVIVHWFVLFRGLPLLGNFFGGNGMALQKRSG